MILKSFPFSAYKDDKDKYFKIEFITKNQTNIKYFDSYDLSMVQDYVIDMQLQSVHYVNDNFLLYKDLNEIKSTYYVIDPLNKKIEKSDSSVFQMENLYDLEYYYDFESKQTILKTLEGINYKIIEKDALINTNLIYSFGSIIRESFSEDISYLKLIDLFTYQPKWEQKYIKVVNLRSYEDKIIIKYVSKRDKYGWDEYRVRCIEASTGATLWEYDADILSVYEEIGQACCLKHEKIKGTQLIKSVKVAFIDILTGNMANSYFINPHREDVWISEGRLMGNYRNYGTTKRASGIFDIQNGKIKYEFLFADKKGKPLNVSNYYLLGNGNIYLITWDNAYIINPEENKDFAIVWDGEIQR